jgi:predicted AAA+ superfamily ATPase
MNAERAAARGFEARAGSHTSEQPTQILAFSRPAVLIHGPRQSGKATLARAVGEPRGYRYVSFDDEAMRAAAKTDPVGFVNGLPAKTILDEVQRVPELFTSLKVAIDHRRTPGRFMLTGSANVLFVPNLADSLAGRMGILRLHPLAQCEVEDRRPRFIDTLFRGGFKTGIADRLGTSLAERIVAGGYPAALARPAAARRRAWYRDYVDPQIQRDVRGLTRIHSLDMLSKLLALAAAQTAWLVNIADLARSKASVGYSRSPSACRRRHSVPRRAAPG